uniref:Uncharacterized protein n=1 Tax=Cucumis melo TaxID=3656 RepID=A0A9I9CKZ3_CUCME
MNKTPKRKQSRIKTEVGQSGKKQTKGAEIRGDIHMRVEESGVPLRAKLCVEGYGSGSEKQSVEVRRGREEGGGFP